MGANGGRGRIKTRIEGLVDVNRAVSWSTKGWWGCHTGLVAGGEIQSRQEYGLYLAAAAAAAFSRTHVALHRK